MKILITGAAGFIGSALCKRLLKNKENVLGIDNLNSYYDPKIKYDRLKEISLVDNGDEESWQSHNLSLEDDADFKRIFINFSPKVVVHLAAQAGVRYSITNPDKYISSNLVGFGNVLELCRNGKVDNFIYA
tara:strand:+ start:329 stop:721 length:393 start_codon:yes stop_codon:yes gene_type:complete